MIRYRPHRATLTASLKDEELFSTQEEMLSSLSETVRRVLAFIGIDRQDELIIGEEAVRNPFTGYDNERKVFVLCTNRRPVCIGYCDLEG